MMSPLTSNEHTSPAGMTNGGVLVGSQPPPPPLPDAAAGTAVTVTMAAARTSAFTTRMWPPQVRGTVPDMVGSAGAAAPRFGSHRMFGCSSGCAPQEVGAEGGSLVQHLPPR